MMQHCGSVLLSVCQRPFCRRMEKDESTREPFKAISSKFLLIIEGCFPFHEASIGITDRLQVHSKKKLINLTRFGCFSCKSVCVKFCSIACPKGSIRKFNSLLYV